MAVQVFKATDQGAPTLNNVAGNFISLLEACLVTGYNTQAIVSITRSGSTVTVVTNLAHGFESASQGFRWITILGANQEEYNGTFKVSNFIDAYTFTYTIVGTPVSPGTGGSIVAKIAGAGWTKPFTGTNQSAFQQPAGSNGFFLWVQDAGSAGSVQCRGYEVLTAVNTGSGPFPTAAQNTNGISLYRQNALEDWTLITNGKFFYFLHTTATYGNQLFYFGDMDGLSINADIYNTIIAGELGSSTYYNYAGKVNEPSYKNIARDLSQSGGSLAFYYVTDGATQLYLGAGVYNYPDPARSCLLMSQVGIYSSYSKRGYLPGVLNPLHNSRVLADNDTFLGSDEFLGKRYMYKYVGSSGQAGALCFEVSDTW